MREGGEKERREEDRGGRERERYERKARLKRVGLRKKRERGRRGKLSYLMIK